MQKQELLRQLLEFMPVESVLSDPEELKAYESDALTAYRQTPMLVAMPDTEDQVARLLALCHETSTPLVARGAGTGLSGGALPHATGVLLSMAKFNRILRIDPLSRTATVQPGVRNLAVSQAASPHNLYYAPDPSSQIACTIGGNVAENSGGVHCLKYGLTVHNVLRARALTITGASLEIGSEALDTCGYDLLALMHGSEGMLAVITEVTVKLLAKPERAQIMLSAFDDIEKAGAAVGNIISAGIVPAGLEMMDRLAIKAAEAFVHAGYPLDAEALLLCELDGTNEEVSEEIMEVRDIVLASGAVSARTALDEKERQKWWDGRKAAFPAVGRLAPDYYCMDGAIPKKMLPSLLHRIAELSTEFGLPVANVFHAGDGNLHPLILYDANRPGQLAEAERLGAKILELCVEAGGTITGEHGVGMEKIDQMCVQFGTAELSIFHGIKRAWDEKGLLNPGKAVPTLHRCAELGAMHVHQGQLTFPDLPTAVRNNFIRTVLPVW